MSEPPSITLTLGRGLQVLRAFRAERTPLTNAELVRRTALSRSAVSRLTATLLQLGYLRRVAGSKELELAPAGFGIGHAYTRTNPLAQVVQAPMQAMADRLGVSVALAVPDGLDMLYVAYRASARVATLRKDVGSLVPIARTAIGRAWLWGLPPPAREAKLQAVLDDAGPQAPRLRPRIEQAFDELARTGVCVTVGEYQHNAYGVALPLRLGRSQTLMAMNCGAVGVASEVEALRERLAAVLRQGADEIAALLRDADVQP